MRKHIPFNKQEILEEANKDVNTKTKLTDLSIKFSIESSKLLKAAHAKILDEKTIREIAVDLKKQLDEKFDPFHFVLQSKTPQLRGAYTILTV